VYLTLKHQKDGRSFKGMISGFDDLKGMGVAFDGVYIKVKQ